MKDLVNTKTGASVINILCRIENNLLDTIDALPLNTLEDADKHLVYLNEARKYHRLINLIANSKDAADLEEKLVDLLACLSEHEPQAVGA
ncbi:MAG: hypothetical protein BWY90_00110 [Deltaproteobacteria bacterium ADurb.BinA014]|nr:MAG: hypothetical protein BWY90_00110 [Deltaproteobacteria bacterium ADurb.BinA014]